MLKRSQTKIINLPDKNRLTKEVGIVLLIKFTLLFIIWLVCFSHPPIKHLDDHVFVEHILNQSTQQGTL